MGFRNDGNGIEYENNKIAMQKKILVYSKENSIRTRINLRGNQIKKGRGL